jgi:hypothetical protein
MLRARRSSGSTQQELHANYGLKPKRLAEAEKLVKEHLNEIRSAWAKHFPG